MLRVLRSSLYEALEALSSTSYEEWEPNMAGWFGLFTSNDHLMAAGHSVQEPGWPQYRVQPDGRLSHLEGEEIDVEDGNIERIKIVGFSGKAWFCDPVPAKVSCTWKLWAQELHPLVRL